MWPKSYRPPPPILFLLLLLLLRWVTKERGNFNFQSSTIKKKNEKSEKSEKSEKKIQSLHCDELMTKKYK